ncbi:MAG TPA: hypothetical protein ENJ18_10315 [Nannocystis exedens]|nr:hypothetical protein [Nannocystis exedens]
MVHWLRGSALFVGIAVAPLMGACDRDVDAGAELLQDLESADYRNSYTRAPGWGRRLQGESPHGGWVDIYINDVMVDAIADNVPLATWPVGSRVVIEGWANEGSEVREFLAVMSKPVATDTWYWAEWGADDVLVYSGEDIVHCMKCHDAGEDDVRAFDLPPISTGP